MSEVRATLESLVDRPSAVAWFKDLFRLAHLEVEDTGERFTVMHRGTGAEVVDGFEGDRPNFVIAVPADAIGRLAAAFGDDEISADEEFRIVRFMLRPCLEAALRMPILTHPKLRAVLRLDDVWQEAILDPTGQETEKLTAICEDNVWRVEPGYHGAARRRLIMRPDQALDFQRRLFRANEQSSIGGWLDLATWYVGWRETVTVRLDGV